MFLQKKNNENFDKLDETLLSQNINESSIKNRKHRLWQRFRSVSFYARHIQ